MTDAPQNETSQEALWNGPAGQGWVEARGLLDALFRPFEERLVEAAVAAAARSLLDVGCGTGGVSLALARALGASGRVLGVDISRPMIAAAEARAAAAGVETVGFLRADAGTHAFLPGGFDMILSRFGVMFFEEPARAFANLRRAAAAEARLLFQAWRRPEETPFMTAAERAAAPLLPNLAPRPADGPGQFAFADAERVRGILEEGGWGGIEILPLDVPCRLPAAALDRYVGRLGPVGRALRDLDEATRAAVTERVRAALEPYLVEGEARFTAACWTVAARA